MTLMSDEAMNADKKPIFDGFMKRRILINEKGNPELTPDTTGKVIVSTDREEVLVGAYFSNVDLNWYDAEGNKLTELMENYHGRKWSMRFTMRDHDRFGKDHEFTSQLIAPLGIGEIGPTDWKGIPVGEELEVSIAIKAGAFSGFDDPYLKKYLHCGCSCLVAFMSPKKKVVDLEAQFLFLSSTLMLDDHWDNNTLFNRQLTFGEICIVRDKLLEVLYGKRDPEKQQIDFEFPIFKPICRLFHLLRESLLKKAATREIAERCLFDMHQYLNAVVLSNSAEWIDYKAQCKTGTQQRAHSDLRRFDAGVIPCWTIKLICNGNTLSKEIHDSHLYQYLRRLVADHIVYVNDMFSYKKEMKEKETCNTVYSRHYEEGRDFLEVLESCVADANNIVVDIFEIGNLLLKMYNNDKQLEQAIYLMKADIVGHIHWYNFALRYHNGILFDCVIHPEADNWNWSFADTEEKKIEEQKG